MQLIFDTASRLSTPLAVAGFVAAIFFFVIRQLLKKGIFPKLAQHHSSRIIILIIDRLFTLSLVALVFGFVGYTVALFAPTTLSQPFGDSILRRMVEAGLPETSHPVVDLSRPTAIQVQLFAEDKVRIPGVSEAVSEVWFGNHWEPFALGREYLVWGVPGQPITPQFRGRGQVKLEITFTKYRDRPRDLRGVSVGGSESEKKLK